MIVPDINLLVYAHNDGAPYHDSARRWWEDLVNGSERVGVPWVVSTGFVRLMTHPRALVHPATPARAVDYVREWFRFPHIAPINPGADHLTHLTAESGRRRRRRESDNRRTCRRSRDGVPGRGPLQ